MSAVIIFNSNNLEQEVLNQLALAGFQRSWRYGETEIQTLFLPNNTVWRINTSIEEANLVLQNALRKVAIDNGVAVGGVKYLVLPANPWKGISQT